MNVQELFSKLQPNPQNPRKHTAEDIQRIAKKMQDFPEMLEKRPVVYDSKDNYNVLGGNLRLKGMQVAVNDGFILKPEYFVDASDWTAEMKRKFIALDNISDGEWDLEKLAEQYTAPELSEWGLDILKNGKEETKEDEPPSVSQTPPISVPGEVYQLGAHRLMCGDATRSEDMKALMGGVLADMIFTDPPYLMGFTGNVHSDGSKSRNAEHGAILNDKMTEKEGREFLSKITDSIRIFTKGAFYICFYRLGLHNLFKALEDSGMEYKSLIIWNKGNHTLSNSDYMSKYEPIVYGWIEQHIFNGKPEFDIWDIQRTQVNDLHPTMKPISLCARAIRNSSNEHGIVLDLFGGSGSTLIACEQINRKCYMMELDPKYCDVIRKRYWKFTHDDKEDGWIEGTSKISG